MERPENFDENCGPVRSNLEISLVFRSKLHSRAEHPENFDENCAPVQSIFINSLIVGLKLRSRAEHLQNSVIKVNHKSFLI